MSNSENVFTSTQFPLIYRMKQVIPTVDMLGICYGISCMAIQAILANELDSFDKRIALINSIPEKDFMQTINNARETRTKIINDVNKKLGPYRKLTQDEINSVANKDEIENFLLSSERKTTELVRTKMISEKEKETEIERRKNMHLFNLFKQQQIEEALKAAATAEDQSILDIPAFFEGVELYHQPFFHTEKNLFENSKEIFTQNLMDSKPLTMSKKLEDQGGFCIVSQFSGLYTNDELHNYFTSFSQSVKNCGTVVLLLRSGNHAITVAYESQRKLWHFIDPNQLPSKRNLDNKTIASLVSDVYARNGIATFLTQVIVNKSQEYKVSQNISVWKNQSLWQEMHKVTPVKAELTDAFDIPWLFIAIRQGNLETVQKLLAAQANPNAVIREMMNTTPLITATEIGNYQIVKALLAANADVNSAQSQNFVALHYAVQNGKPNIVRMLLEYHASPDKVAEGGITPLIIAANFGHLDILKLLLETKPKVDVNKRNDHGETALFLAAQEGYLEIVQALLQAGADPNIAKLNGVTPLFIAAQYGHIDIVKELLDAKADPQLARKTDSIKPKDIARSKGHDEVAAVLLTAELRQKRKIEARDSVMHSTHLSELKSSHEGEKVKRRK